MSELGPNLEVVSALAQTTVEGRYAVVLLAKYESMEGYMDWVDAALRHLNTVGGKLIWAGIGGDPIVGDPDRTWDTISIVELPSQQAFVDLVNTPGWDEVEGLRLKGLIRHEIYGCLPVIDAIDRP